MHRSENMPWQNAIAQRLLGPAYAGILLSLFCVLFRGKRGAVPVCGKRLAFQYTSPFEHAQYNVWGP